MNLSDEEMMGKSAQGEFESYNRRFFYGVVVKVTPTHITLQGSVKKNRRKRTVFYTFLRSSVIIQLPPQNI